MATSNTPKMCYRPRKFMKTPCYGCEERQVGCHGTCARYKAFQQESYEDWQRRADTYRAEVTAETFGIEQKLKTLRKKGNRR